MTDAPDRRLLLASARADLLEGGGAPEREGVPDHVAASWRRSVAGGVPPDSVETQYFTELDLGSRLVRCAAPVIDQLAEQIAGVPMCVALTDDRARILARRDSSRWLGRILDRVYFAQGFGYAEGAVGTNGVGTVLEFGESVHIVGAEHFVGTLQAFACAGAPVRDPFTGRIEGVLDISCLADHSTPLMHSLVRDAARRIEHNLVRDRDQAQQALFDVYSRVDARTRGAVLAVGPRVVVANTSLQTLLAAGDQEALHDHLRFLAGRHDSVDQRIDLPSGARVRLRGSTVAVGDDVAGMIGVVTLLDEVDAHPADHPAAPAVARPRGASSSPGWCAAAAAARAELDAGNPVLVLGEPGSGRVALLSEQHLHRNPGGRIARVAAPTVEADPQQVAAAVAEPGEGTLTVLCDVDRLSPRAAERLVAALAEHGGAPALLAATAATAATATTATAADGSAPSVHRSLLAVFRGCVTVPPLRHRTADLPALAREILDQLAPHREVRLSAEATRLLTRYRWPGNVRELREVLAAAVARRPVGAIEAADLPARCQSTPRSALRPVDEIERDAIVSALRATGGNRKAAAAALGIARSTVYRKIRQYGITD
ncbi:Fis family transcriptional regulator [Pseudonocardia sp. RS11V-5]|uniref:sigma-54-dependent Fis family transcriptional regulator n=1 Tax=Pseudonocardia terrae TaxID=2905831 RepID=UPI001E3196B9|nr:helix-turn-helix domain-containing protein [Pseudonocardia terrae]MCE3554115.1 Fis family transcriptional regulator [Pseudonocardia terrae]